MLPRSSPDWINNAIVSTIRPIVGSLKEQERRAERPRRRRRILTRGQAAAHRGQGEGGGRDTDLDRRSSPIPRRV